MSFILNALKKAESKSFAKENIKIKKQVLILKRQAKGKKVKNFSLIVIFSGILLVGWFLGRLQYDQSKPAADLSSTQRLLADKTVLAEKNALVDQVKKSAAPVSSDNSSGGADDQIIKPEYNIEKVNPPIPIRAAPGTVNIQLTEDAPITLEQTETKKAVNSIENYSELPFLIKQKLPQLEISLHFYNSNPARRIVRINGKILHEDDTIAERLIVQEIKPTSAVLNFDGYLFELNAPGSGR